VTGTLEPLELRAKAFADRLAAQAAADMESIVYFWELTGGYPGWAYWLRHRGSVLWGRDVRESISLPADPRRLLEASLWGNLIYNRQHLFLRLLIEGKYVDLLAKAAGLARRLMATALLVCGQWEVEEASIFDRFSRAFGTGGDAQLCAELCAALGARRASATGGADREDLERRVCEAVWLVESLARMLRRYAG